MTKNAVARVVAISPESCQSPFAGSRGNHVIARNEAISVFYRWRTAKREIASQARNDKKCSREERGDLSWVLSKPLYGVAMVNPVLARVNSVIESAAWRSRLSRVGKYRKERLLRRLAMTKNAVARVVAISPESCHREERGDLGCEGLTNSQKRDCFAGSQ